MTNRTDLIYTRYPVLRSAMSETLDTLDDIAFAATVEQSFEGWSADELEINFSNLGRSLGRGLGQVGNVAARAAPGALTGAMQGASMGAALGPYGMLAGAALGAVGGGITSYSQSQQRAQQPAAAPQQVPQQRPAMAQPAPRPQTYAPAPAAPVAPAPQMPQQNVANAQAMTAQLLQILSRPEVIQALLSLSAGAMGRRNIPVGTTTRAPEDILEAIGFALQAPQAAAYGWTESHPSGPGAEVYEAMATTMPEDHPFGQTLAMLSDAVDLNDPADAAPAYPTEAASPHPALPPEYV